MKVFLFFHFKTKSLSSYKRTKYKEILQDRQGGSQAYYILGILSNLQC